MLPMYKSDHEGEPNPLYIAKSLACAQPWWRSKGCNSFSSVMMQGNASDSSSLEQSLDGQLHSDSGISEKDDDTSKQSPIAIPSQPDRNYRQEDMNLQQVAPTIHPNDGNLIQPSQLQQLGLSLGFGAYPCDPYYGGVMAAYGQPSARMPLEMAQEIVYVNPKQYLGIMRRRQSRAKAEVEKKLIKERKPYLHESRHLHAMRRERGSGDVLRRNLIRMLLKGQSLLVHQAPNHCSLTQVKKNRRKELTVGIREIFSLIINLLCSEPLVAHCRIEGGFEILAF